MKHVDTGNTPQAVEWLKGPPRTAAPSADEARTQAISSAVAEIQRRFLTIRSVAGSPLRDDLELSLAELDALIPALQAMSPVLTYLQFEMENHVLKIIDALQYGSEL